MQWFGREILFTAQWNELARTRVALNWNGFWSLLNVFHLTFTKSNQPQSKSSHMYRVFQVVWGILKTKYLSNQITFFYSKKSFLKALELQFLNSWIDAYSVEQSVEYKAWKIIGQNRPQCKVFYSTFSLLIFIILIIEDFFFKLTVWISIRHSKQGFVQASIKEYKRIVKHYMAEGQVITSILLRKKTLFWSIAQFIPSNLT